MSEYAAQFNMPERVRQLADSIVLTSDIVIITPEAERQLMALAASPLNTIDLSVYTAVVSIIKQRYLILLMFFSVTFTVFFFSAKQQNYVYRFVTNGCSLESDCYAPPSKSTYCKYKFDINYAIEFIK